MSVKNSKPMGLGRGLNALFDTSDIKVKESTPIIKSNDAVNEVLVSQIKPNPTQPRQKFNDESIAELSESIKALGLIQPITLRKVSDESYTIVSGERRYRAAKLAGLTSLPAYVRSVDSNTMLEMALVENIQREDLNPMEIAFTFSRLIDECGMTQDKLSERVGKKRSTISNYIRLIKLPAELQLSIAEGLISMGHAKAIMSLEQCEKQIELLELVINESLSVRQTEAIAKDINNSGEIVAEPEIEQVKEQKPQEAEYPESYTRLVERLESLFSQDISIKRSPKGSGKIVIGFKGDEDIEGIISKLETLNR